MRTLASISDWACEHWQWLISMVVSVLGTVASIYVAIRIFAWQQRDKAIRDAREREEKERAEASNVKVVASVQERTGGRRWIHVGASAKCPPVVLDRLFVKLPDGRMLELEKDDQLFSEGTQLPWALTATRPSHRDLFCIDSFRDILNK